MVFLKAKLLFQNKIQILLYRKTQKIYKLIINFNFNYEKNYCSPGLLNEYLNLDA